MDQSKVSDLPDFVQRSGAPEIEKSKQTSFAKFGRAEWNKIERNYDNPYIIRVLETMCRLEDPNYKPLTLSSLTSCGDNVYNQIIRPELVKLGFLKEELVQNKKKKNNVKKHKNNKKRGMTAKEIREKNTTSKVRASLLDILKVIKYTLTPVARGLPLQVSVGSGRDLSPMGFKSKYVELRLATFIYYVYYHINGNNEEKAYELVIGIAKTVSNVEKIRDVSKTALNDLQRYYKKLKDSVNFKYETLFKKYPRLILSTCYDDIFPTTEIAPYDSQVKLMDALKKHDKCLYLYSAMIGSGKTTFSVALIKFVERLRARNKKSSKYKGLQVLFACSVEPVRHQVSRIAYNMDFPFAVATIDQRMGESTSGGGQKDTFARGGERSPGGRSSGGKDTVRVINNYNCKYDENRLLIIADLNSTIELLKMSQNYILFLDEPTVGADQPNHPITRSVAKVMLIAPERTILSSATLPKEEEILPIVEYFKNRHGSKGTGTGAQIVNIRSKEAMVGCEMITYSGATITPHNNCTSSLNLANIVDRIKKTAFVDRLYTAPVLYRLVERMKLAGIKEVIDLEEHFSDITKLSQNEIQKVAITILEYLQNLNNDELVVEVCKPLSNTTKYDIDRIFTSDAHKFLGSCLVTVNNPLKFAYEKSQQLLKNLDFNRLIKKYTKEQSIYDVKRDKLKSVKNEKERSRKEQELNEFDRPILKIPDYIKINTPDHIKLYATGVEIDKKLVQQIIKTEIPLDFNITDWMYLLLFAGVGVYSPSDDSIDKRYTDLILNFASEGKLSFLIADDHISYGANYPFSHVIITDEVANNHSLLTIFQLSGRAGRVGTSWVAWAHVSDKIGERVVNYIKNNENIRSEEATNLVKIFGEVRDEVRKTK